MTPRVGTPMRTQLENEGRVIIPDADLYTNNFRCMFVPKNMSPQEVEEGVWRCTKEFYSLKSMFEAPADAAGQVHLAGPDREHALLLGREAADRSGGLLLGDRPARL